MIAISVARARQLLAALAGRKILVLGDVMLDRYLWGRVSRVSPEAPVPVVEVDEEALRLGGAANVARNVLSLGGVPLLVGLVGEAGDADTRALSGLMTDLGLGTEGLIEEAQRRTTVKTRIIAHSQHVVRADRETRISVGPEAARRLADRVREWLPQADAVILQDYNKGVFSTRVLAELLPELTGTGRPVTVDPKFECFFEYRGVSVFKPNLKEAEAALGIPLNTEENIEQAAHLLQRRLKCRHVLITRGERGMTLLEEEGSLVQIPTHARRVFDVSGAGDTVIGTLTCMLAAGADIREATALANYAAGVVVGQVGVVPIEVDALLEAVRDRE